jgi:hypothetical protein
MKLPHDAIIATRKITEYLLRWRPEDDKSAFLAQAGYTVETSERLVTDIREQLLPLGGGACGGNGVWPEVSDSRRADRTERTPPSSGQHLDD